MVSYRRDRVYNAVVYLLLGLIGLVCFFPMLYVVIVSLTPYNEYLRQGGVVLIPRQITLEAYSLFWQEPYVAQCFANTVLITVAGTAMNLAATVLMAYALSKKDLIGRRSWTFFCLIPMLISGGMVPTYLVVKDTGLLDTLWSLMIPALISPYTLLITRTFFSGIDQALHESARMDGAKEFRMERAAALLRRGDLKVYEVAEQLGYQNYRSFSSAFERQYHVSPKKYRG